MQARALAGLLALVLLGACSSSGDGSAATPSPSTASPTTLSGSSFTLPPSGPVDDDDQGIGPPTPSELAGWDTLPRPRVCAMVPVDAVSAATGAAVASSSEAAFGDTITCFVVDAQNQNLVSVATGPVAVFDAAAAATDATPVDGLGEAAVWSGGKLHVHVGDEDVAVRVFPAAGVADSDALAVATTIAGAVMTHYQPPS